MVFARRWSGSRLLAGYPRCRRGGGDHGQPSAGQGRFHGPRVHRGRSTPAAPLAHGQALAPAQGLRTGSQQSTPPPRRAGPWIQGGTVMGLTVLVLGLILFLGPHVLVSL